MAFVKTWVLAAFLLQSVPTPLRLGDLAGKLTAQDVMDLEKVAVAAGAKGSPWLLESPVGQLGNNAIRIYLSAETQTRELRRGPAIELFRRQGQTTWSPPAQTIQYAQVLKPGQDVNSISGEQRPFSVSGGFSDEELLGIVTLIRRGEGGARIISLSSGRNSDTSAMVTLTAPGGKLRMVSLTRKGSGWKVQGAETGMP